VTADLNEWDVMIGRVSGRWDHASLKVQPFSQTPSHFDAGAQICIAAPPGRRLLKVLHSKRSGHSFILNCGIDSTAEAQAMIGAELFIHPSMRPPLPEDEFYIDELLGMRVQTEAGDDWGEIEEVLETPAHDVYVTPCAMIPGHSEFIVSTDWENRVLVVRDVPGLRTDVKDEAEPHG
jgi:16S rRNA processing protein RimM